MLGINFEHPPARANVSYMQAACSHDGSDGPLLALERVAQPVSSFREFCTRTMLIYADSANAIIIIGVLITFASKHLEAEKRSLILNTFNIAKLAAQRIELPVLWVL